MAVNPIGVASSRQTGGISVDRNSGS